MTIRVIEISSVITDKVIGAQLLSLIKENLETNDEIIIDFDNVYTMTTSCAKYIFGDLYLNLGASDFFRKIKIINTVDDLKMIINHGIQKSLS